MIKDGIILSQHLYILHCINAWNNKSLMIDVYTLHFMARKQRKSHNKFGIEEIENVQTERSGIDYKYDLS